MKFIIGTFVLLGFLQLSWAEETLTEKAQLLTRDLARTGTPVASYPP